MGEDVANHSHGEFPGGQFVDFQVIRCVDEHLVDGVDVDVLFRHIFEIGLVDPRAIVYVVRHAGGSDDVVEAPFRVLRQFDGGGRFACESVERRLLQSAVVDALH